MTPEIALFSPVEALTEVPPLPQAHSDAQLIEIWLHGRSLHTQRAYRADVARFRRGTEKPLPSVTLTDLQCFADSLGTLAAASRYRILSALKSLLAFGHRIGYLPFDVGRALRLPGVRNRLTERILPEAEIHHILSLEPKERNRVLLTLLYASAVRVSELCDLCWRDARANGDGGQITVFGKGDQTRSIQLPASVWKRDRVLGIVIDAARRGAGVRCRTQGNDSGDSIPANSECGCATPVPFPAYSGAAHTTVRRRTSSKRLRFLRGA